jgi:signal transduction histidine kinase
MIPRRHAVAFAITIFYNKCSSSETISLISLYTFGSMRRRSRRHLSSKAKLITLAIVAVMLPTTVLSVIQYNSLVDLESKTKVAVQENLRQTMQTLTRKVEDNLKGLAKETLDPISYEDVEQNNLQKIEQHFTAIKQARPEIDHIFVFSFFIKDKEYVLFHNHEGLRRIDLMQLEQKENADAYMAYKAYNGARLSRTSMTWKSDFLFWQVPCCKDNWSKTSYQYTQYIFRTVFCPDSVEMMGYAGFTLTPNYMREQYLPQIVPALLAECDIDDKDSALALGIVDESGGEVYATKPGVNDYEVKMAFSPVFPRWNLALGYKDTTIEALAKDNFQKNLMLTLFVLSLLIIGIILTLRATAREMKLAQAKSTFVSNVSHELKTPLALIRLFAETLELGRVKSNDKAKEYYRIINNESRRLTQLINNILDFSKIEAGRKEYEFVESDITEVVEEVIRSYEFQIINAGFELNAHIEHDLPPVSIDRDAISQAVLNLVNNAVKYSDEVKEITVLVRSRDHSIAIEVADKGIGIPRSEQNKIFEKFYRVSTGLVHDTKGSGLGLALVKHIVEAHDGKIIVESTPGKGSRFTMLIPANGAVDAAKEMKLDGGYKVAESSNN